MHMKRILIRNAVGGVLVCAALAAGPMFGGARGAVVHAQMAGPVVVADAVLGGGPGVPPDQICAIRSTFPQGQDIVFRVKVIDPATGQSLDNTALQNVTITLPDGSVEAMEYGSHPPGPAGGLDAYWTYAFMIPADYPTGVFNYSIAVTDLNGNIYAPVGFNTGVPTVIITPAGQF